MDQAKEAAAVVTEFFQGNPFSTPVGQKIEQATDGSLASENWGLNMEICDMINMNEECSRDAARALKKRLQNQMGKNNTSVIYTLTVLETAVKNCDRRFHQLIAQKDFINELVRLIGPKFDPPQVVQERVLSLIQAWAEAFRGYPDLKGVGEVYEDLKSKGVEFPMTDLDSMAPILTPKRTVPAPAPAPIPTPVAQTSPHHQVAGPPGLHMSASGTINPSPEQLAKLRSELDIVNGNLKVLREMLSELAPGQEDPEDLALLRDLYQTCRSMQKRVMTLLQCVANEEVTNELLLINDELNNVFVKYERYMKNRSPQPTTATQPTQPPNTGDASLIDFGGEKAGTTDLSAQLANMSVAGAGSINNVPSGATPGTAGADGFDMFAQNRTATYEQSKQTGSTYSDNTVGLDQIGVSLGEAAQQRPTGVVAGDKETEVKEMEAWLDNKSESSYLNRKTPKPRHRFQATQSQCWSKWGRYNKRAETGEQLPPVSNQVKKKEEEEEKMFAL